MNAIKVEVEEEGFINVESDTSCFICLQLIPPDNEEQFNSLNFLLSYLKIRDKVTSVVCEKCEENLARFVKLSKALEKVRLEMDYLLSLFQSSISNNVTSDEFTSVRESLMKRCGKAISNPTPEVNLERVDISKLGKMQDLTHLTPFRENPKLQIILPRLDVSKLIKTPPSTCSDDWTPNLEEEFDKDFGLTNSFATPVTRGIKGIKMEIVEDNAATFKRTKCSKTCVGIQHMRRHNEAVHIRSKPFKCTTCLKTFPTNRNLRRHVDGVHLHLKPYKCDICEMSFGYKTYLKSHKESVHLGLKPFKCSKCNLMFTRMSSLNAHIKVVHLQLKPHKCDICDISFARSRSLRLHKARLHIPTLKKVPVTSSKTNTQTFSCDICKKSYHILKSLKEHKRIAHQKEMLSCDICKKMFTQRFCLNVHIRTVHEKRRHYCQVSGCDRSFSQRSQVFEHYILQHPGFSVPRATEIKTTKSSSVNNLDNNLKVDEIFKQVRILNID